MVNAISFLVLILLPGILTSELPHPTLLGPAPASLWVPGLIRIFAVWSWPGRHWLRAAPCKQQRFVTNLPLGRLGSSWAPGHLLQGLHNGPVRWEQLPPVQRLSGCCDQGAESPQDSQVSEFQRSFLLRLSRAPTVSLQLSLVVRESFLLLPFLLSLLPTQLLSCSPTPALLSSSSS